MILEYKLPDNIILASSDTNSVDTSVGKADELHINAVP